MSSANTSGHNAAVASGPRVVIAIRRGMTYVFSEGNVDVLTLDYDVDGAGDDETALDVEGERCFVNSEVVTDRHLVRQAFGHFEK